MVTIVERVVRGGPTLAIALFMWVLAGGRLGYTLIEKWEPRDALDMTLAAVATVAYEIEANS